MTQGQILEAIKSHLDDLRSLLNWALLFAVPFWWAGLQQSASLTVIGMQVPRGQALSVAAFFYLLTNLAMLDRFLRLRDLLVALDPGNVSEGVSRLFLHPWLFNPFTCFGTGAAIRRLHTVTGTGLLIVAWCACDASLYVLSPPGGRMTPIGILLQGAFFLTGCGTLLAIARVNETLIDRIKASEPLLWGVFAPTRVARAVSMGTGVLCGSLIVYVASQ